LGKVKRVQKKLRRGPAWELGKTKKLHCQKGGCPRKSDSEKGHEEVSKNDKEARRVFTYQRKGKKGSKNSKTVKLKEGTSERLFLQGRREKRNLFQLGSLEIVQMCREFSIHKNK